MEIPFYQRVRLAIYDLILVSGNGPAINEIALALGASSQEIHDALLELTRRHLIYLSPETERIQMAWPLSGIQTPYPMSVKGVKLYANCAWDLFGIPAMLDLNAEIAARCIQSGQLLHFNIKDGSLDSSEGVIHFALPLRKWYDDIVFT